MTAVLEDTVPAVPDEAPVRYASWGARLAAIALDVLPGLGALATLGIVVVTTSPGTWLRWVLVSVIAVVTAAMLANRVLLPSLTGFTLGRAVCGIRVVRPDDSPVGVLRLLLRDVAHLLDTAAVCIGWLWPLWDKRSRTFADLLARTEVRVVEPPKRDVRRIAGGVLVAAVLVSAAAAGLGYAVVFRYERAVEQARTQISEQGPRIVEQMLSYAVDSVGADFATAQGLATDGYRSTLIDQQKTAEAAGLTTNEYWAVSSAVLSVDPERAAMLLALQGQRGVNPNDLKFITATVRVDFERIGDQWKVSNLQVLRRPLLPTAPPAPSPSPETPSAPTSSAPAPSAPQPGAPR